MDECHGVDYTAAEDIHGGKFVGEIGSLSGGNLEIAGYATLVARNREFQVLLSRGDGFVLNLSLVLEDAQGCQVVFERSTRRCCSNARG